MVFVLPVKHSNIENYPAILADNYHHQENAFAPPPCLSPSPRWVIALSLQIPYLQLITGVRYLYARAAGAHMNLWG